MTFCRNKVKMFHKCSIDQTKNKLNERCNELHKATHDKATD